MGVLEIVLLVAGIGVCIASFVLPKQAEKTEEETKGLAKEEIKAMVSRELEGIKEHVDDVVEEAVGYAVEKTERSLERLTNEKIMAVNEYSDTVLHEIHKNHEEALFLYDMLNSKHNNLKDTVSKVDKTVKEAAETTKEVEAAVSNFQKFVPEEVIKNDVMTEDGVEKAIVKAKRIPSKTSTAKAADEKANAKTEATAAAEPGTVNISFIKDNESDGVNSNEKILELYKQGKSTIAIAKELGLGVGEVKLVIDLYKNM